MNVIIIPAAVAIMFIVLFILLIIWAEKHIKKHPELVGEREKDNILNKLENKK